MKINLGILALCFANVILAIFIEKLWKKVTSIEDKYFKLEHDVQKHVKDNKNVKQVQDNSKRSR